MGALELSRAIYARLKAIPLDGADAETRHVLTRTLADSTALACRAMTPRAARIAAINDAITALEIGFAENIADGRNTVTADPAELEGLPADYIAAHPPGADGKVVISTDHPDLLPVLTYARSEALRRRLYEANTDPRRRRTTAVLRDIIAQRDALAGCSAARISRRCSSRTR